jgi:hypothetical protein
MLYKAKAPVEETTNYSSRGITLPGKGEGSLPVAMMMFLALIFSVPPPMTSTSISF